MNNLSPIGSNLTQTQFLGREQYQETLKQVSETKYNVFANQLCKEFPGLDQFIRQAVEMMFLDHMNDLNNFKACVLREIHGPEDVQFRIIEIASEIFHLGSQTEGKYAKESLPTNPKDKKTIKATEEKLSSEVTKTAPSIDFEKVEDLIELAGLESEAEVIEFFKNLHSVITSGQQEVIYQAFPNGESVLLLVKMLKHSNVEYAKLATDCLIDLAKLDEYNITAAVKEGLYWALGDVFARNAFCVEFLQHGGFLKILSIIDKEFDKYCRSNGENKKELEKAVLFADRALSNLLTNNANSLDISMQTLINTLIPQFERGSAKLKVWVTYFFGSIFPKLKSDQTQLLIGEHIVPELIKLLNQNPSIVGIEPTEDDTDEDKARVTALKTDREKCMEVAGWSLHKLAFNPKVAEIMLKNNILNELAFPLFSGAQGKALEGILLSLGEVLPANCLHHQMNELRSQQKEIYTKIVECLTDNNQAVVLSAARAINNLGKKRGFPKEYALQAFPHLLKLSCSQDILKAEASLWALGNFALTGLIDEHIKDELLEIIPKNIFLDANQDAKVVEAASFCYLNLFEKVAQSSNQFLKVNHNSSVESTSSNTVTTVSNTILSCTFRPFDQVASKAPDLVLKQQINSFVNILVTSPHNKVKESMLWKLHKSCTESQFAVKYLTHNEYDIIVGLLAHPENLIANGALWVFGKIAPEYKNVYGNYNTSIIENSIEALLSQIQNKDEKTKTLAIRNLGTLCANDDGFVCAKIIGEKGGIALLINALKETKSPALVQTLVWNLVALSGVKKHESVIFENLDERFIFSLLKLNVPKISEGVIRLCEKSPTPIVENCINILLREIQSGNETVQIQASNTLAVLLDCKIFRFGIKLA